MQKIVWIITGYYHKNDSEIINMLTRKDMCTDPIADNRVSGFVPVREIDRIVDVRKVPMNELIHSSHLTTRELRMSGTRASVATGYGSFVVLGGFDANHFLRKNFSERMIFEVAKNGSEYVYLPGDTPRPFPGGLISQCIITLVNGEIVVEVDKVCIDINPKGEFGSFLETPFARSRRALLRRQMYNLQYLEANDSQHELFDKVCDLAHRTIWELIH